MSNVRKVTLAVIAAIATIVVIVIVVKLRVVWDHATRFDNFCILVKATLRDDQERLLDPKEREFVLRNFWHYGRYDGAEPLARCQAKPVSGDKFSACEASKQTQCYIDLAKEVELNLIPPL